MLLTRSFWWLVAKLMAGWRFIGRIPQYTSFIVFIGALAWTVNTFKDELKGFIFGNDVAVSTEQAVPPQAVQPEPAPPPSKPPLAQKTFPMPELDAPATSLPLPSPDEEWIPLSHNGEIRVKGISFIYTTYAQLGSRPPVVSVLVDGKSTLLREKEFANIIGDNGLSCIVRVKDITDDSLYFNLKCYD